MLKMLDFDSALLEKPVAKIEGNISYQTLPSFLEQARTIGVAVTYLFVAEENVLLNQMATVLGGVLVDRKITFLRTNLKHARIEDYDNEVSPFKQHEVTQELRFLALESGKFSRFQRDRNFPSAFFEKLYLTWIHRSVKRELADVIFVKYIHQKLVGMVTVSAQNERMDIGLLAVHPHFVGQKIGKALVYAALNYAKEKNFERAQVITQGNNTAGYRLYQSCGYHVRKVEYVYHFWNHT